MQALDFLAPFGLGTHDDQVDTGSYLAAYVLAGTASGMTARVSF